MKTHDLIADCQKAGAVIAQGGVVCYPTEAVWGLGCDPRSASAFEKILSLKQRPADKGVILIAANERHITPYADIPKHFREHLSEVWPGFVTCLLPKSADCPDYLTGQHDTVAVRLTSFEPVRRLCLAADSALVSTSANLSGQPPVKDIFAARSVFAGGVDYYLNVALGGAIKPSRIIDFSQQPPRIIRE